MKNKILIVIMCGVLLCNVTGCKKNDNKSELQNEETFINKTTLTDGRTVYYTFNILYNGKYLNEALIYNEITMDEFIGNLNFITDLNDGGSKLYGYSKENKLFGDKDFYTLVCNSYVGIKDIFIAKNTNSLTNMCIEKTDN